MASECLVIQFTTYLRPEFEGYNFGLFRTVAINFNLIPRVAKKTCSVGLAKNGITMSGVISFIILLNSITLLKSRDNGFEPIGRLNSCNLTFDDNGYSLFFRS